VAPRFRSPAESVHLGRAHRVDGWALRLASYPILALRVLKCCLGIVSFQAPTATAREHQALSLTRQ
jgi:hypothetical protein